MREDFFNCVSNFVSDFFFHKLILFSSINDLISGFQRDHAGRTETGQVGKLYICRITVVMIDPANQDLQLPWQTEVPKRKKSNKKNEPLSDGTAGDRAGEWTGSLWTQTKAGKAVPRLASVWLLTEPVRGFAFILWKHNRWVQCPSDRGTRASRMEARSTDVMWDLF